DIFSIEISHLTIHYSINDFKCKKEVFNFRLNKELKEKWKSAIDENIPLYFTKFDTGMENQNMISQCFARNIDLIIYEKEGM
uniref:SAM-dependent methyltransferase n=1 Tax=Meloidogyne hapla TaxID=6305 RepID=A0A1I8BBV7_MELHA